MEKDKQILLDLLNSNNIALDPEKFGLDDEKLSEIGSRVKKDYDTDVGDREEWEKKMERVSKLAMLISERKTNLDGEVVSNVKHPVIATATIQFAARAMPNIVKGKNVVKGKVIGLDSSGEKLKRANRVASHMNFQIVEQMKPWIDGVDEMLHRMPCEGCGFKKTYRDFNTGLNVSEYVSPIDLVIPFKTKDFYNTRKTHRIYLRKNQIIERVNNGLWRDLDYDDNDDGSDDPDALYLFLEQHRWYDLDGDGYEEPYIITVRDKTEEVVRIVARWEDDGVEFNADGKLALIKANEHFTRFLFMPSIDGSVYGMGFGFLLEPMTETINSVLNMLLDAGSEANKYCGFISSRLRISKDRSLYFKNGEWKIVNATGDELRNHIVPFDSKEPSLVLFQLLGLMLEASKELSSMSDVLAGETPAGDVPATTTLALIEQGLKVFSAVHQRIHRSLKEELGKLRRLNELYTTESEYLNIVDDPEARLEDYVSSDFDIIPVTDENEISDTQKLVKAQAWMGMLGMGFNDKYIRRKFAESMGCEDVDAILEQEEQPPSPEEIRAEKELILKEKEIQLESQRVRNETLKNMQELIVLRTKAIKNLAEAEKAEAGTQLDIYTQDVEFITQMIQQQNERNRQDIEIAKLALEAMRGENAKSGRLQTVA